MDKPLFSILTAGHNNRKFLGNWSSSVLAQKYRPLEAVYVNDGSSDGIGKALKAMRPAFDEAGIALKYVKNTNRVYCGSAYRMAHKASQGDFLGILDSDDMLKPDAVEYIVELYLKYPDIGWIYTQYEACNVNMKGGKKGFSKMPNPGETLLSLGKKRVHAYSHWRTFSNRVPNVQSILGEGLKCAVDKYMGYRLEELSKGMFANKVCYLYRLATPGCISKTEPAIATWHKVMRDAQNRRRKQKLRVFPITRHEER